MNSGFLGNVWKNMKAKEIIGIGKEVENVNYPLAMKRIMGLAKLPGSWNSIKF